MSDKNTLIKFEKKKLNEASRTHLINCELCLLTSSSNFFFLLLKKKFMQYNQQIYISLYISRFYW